MLFFMNIQVDYATKNYGQRNNKNNKRTKDKGKGGNKEKACNRFTKCCRYNNSKAS